MTSTPPSARLTESLLTRMATTPIGPLLVVASARGIRAVRATHGLDAGAARDFLREGGEGIQADHGQHCPAEP